MTEEIIIDGGRRADITTLKNEITRLEKEVKHWQMEHREAKAKGEWTYDLVRKKVERLEQENKELKEWKERVVGLFESACRCKYLNEETDICSYTNEKCININKCVYKYQNLSDTYRSALEEIREIAKFAQCLPCGSGNLEDCLNCNDDTTNNGQFCMEKRIHEIKTKCVEVLNEK